MVFELSPVPEPASLVLIGLGMLGLAGLDCGFACSGTAAAGSTDK